MMQMVYKVYCCYAIENLYFSINVNEFIFKLLKKFIVYLQKTAYKFKYHKTHIIVFDHIDSCETKKKISLKPT